MRVVRDILIFLLSLYIAFIAFMPKKEIYFYLEKELNRYGVIIHNEKFKQTSIDLKINNALINYQGVDVARVNFIDIKPLLIKNSLIVEGVELLGLANDALELEIERLTANENIAKPFLITIDATGSFGKANGYIDLKKRLIHIDITDAQNIRKIKKFLKKGDKGWYYESRF